MADLRFYPQNAERPYLISRMPKSRVDAVSRLNPSTSDFHLPRYHKVVYQAVLYDDDHTSIIGEFRSRARAEQILSQIRAAFWWAQEAADGEDKRYTYRTPSI